MKHSSVIASTPCEFIEVTPLNPLVSKCQIKVCYVGDKPNRNRSVITKEVAKEMANSLPGSPIVGLFNAATDDYEEHSRSIEMSGNKFEIKDLTKPYGFVDLNAKCWFQKFIDDGNVEHEYLMTEGYLWTGQYPECKRIIDKGNNQSMELDENSLKASWSEPSKDQPSFFIINEAIISKLCILGEEFEPCFEGATIGKVQYSLFENEEFKTQLFSMMQEIKDLLEKDEEGGTQVDIENINDIEETEVENIEAPAVEAEPEVVDAPVDETPDDSAADIEFKKKEEDDEEDKKDSEEDASDDEKPAEDEENDEESEDKDDEDKKKKKQYSLEEIPEYVELSSKYSELESNFAALQAERDALMAEIEPLRTFKAEAEKAKKVEMIDSFCMLSDEDKADVVANIDTYSLDDIEAKLSIICVRNRVNLNFDTEGKETEKPAINFNLNDMPSAAPSASTPAWVKRALEVAKEMN